MSGHAGARSQEAFQSGRRPNVVPFELELAVQELKRFLEAAREGGSSIRELEIDEQLLFTRTGVNYVMPFVLIAERCVVAARSDVTAPMR